MTDEESCLAEVPRPRLFDVRAFASGQAADGSSPNIAFGSTVDFPHSCDVSRVQRQEITMICGVAKPTYARWRFELFREQSVAKISDRRPSHLRSTVDVPQPCEP